MRLFFLLFLAGTTQLFAADVTGKWMGRMGESGREVVFQLKTNGDQVRGAMSGPGGEPRPITKGELDGGNISLAVASEWQGNPVTLLVRGRVAGDPMKLVVESEDGGWSTDRIVKKAAE